MSSLWIHDTKTYCQAFGSGAVISCFNNLGLSQPGFKHLNFRGSILIHDLKQKKDIRTIFLTTEGGEAFIF